MELIYNELSAQPLFENTAIANQQMIQLIKTYVKSKSHKFKKIRFNKSLHEIAISENYTILDWINTTKQRNLKDLLLEARTYPFINDDDEQQINEYIKHQYFFENIEKQFDKTECLGLAASHIYDTVSISFAEYEIWKSNLIAITKINDETKEENEVEIINVFSPECFNKTEVKTFIDNLGAIAPNTSDLLPDEKIIHLSDHHGKKELNDFSKRLVNCPFVISIKSTNWGGKRFIRKVFDNGMIEIVLTNTQREYALLVETTGKNYRETRFIADIIENEYGI